MGKGGRCVQRGANRYAPENQSYGGCRNDLPRFTLLDLLEDFKAQPAASHGGGGGVLRFPSWREHRSGSLGARSKAPGAAEAAGVTVELGGPRSSK